MMLSKFESGDNSSDGISNSGQLLHDIEAISKALYLSKTPPKTLIAPSDVRSKSVGKTRVTDSKLNSNPRILKEGRLRSDKKPSIWNWKKPLKAITHIRSEKFSCCFYLHVHSIEGLPITFKDISLQVHWKRKDEVLKTRPSKVLNGIADFDENLMYRSCVYGSRSGSQQAAKYKEKLFSVYASVVGAPGIDIGKHWVDLTRLFPLTLEELEGEKRSGKWLTSFKLTGKAKGAILNVSFGFLVMRDNLVESRRNMNISELMNLTKNKTSTMEPGTGFGSSNHNGNLRRVGSVSSNLDHQYPFSSQSAEVKISQEILLNPGLELSKSINFLYQKLDEGHLCCPAQFDKFSEHVELLKPKAHVEFEPSEEINGDRCHNTEFTVIKQGMEMSGKEELKLEQGADQTVEIINIDINEIIKDDDIALDEEMKCDSEEDIGNNRNEVAGDDCKYEKDSVCTKGSIMEEVESDFNSLLFSESTECDSSLAMSEFLEQLNYLEMKSNKNAGKMVKKSLSLDDVSESVASDFLNMLGMEHNSFSSDSDPESPRERLLRQFEKEVLSSGNSIFDFDAKEKQADFHCADPTECHHGDLSEELDLSSVIHAAEEEHKRASLINRRKVKMLEDLEAEALMRAWGLNEKAFQSSPCSSSGGFGSPIQLSPEEPFELPPLGEGFGPVIQMEGGGFLRSMNPSLFRNAKNGGSLVMQVSSPVVLPAEMGCDIMEILQHLASVGHEKLSVQANKLMPLEDITGKAIQQVVESKRQDFVHHESLFGSFSFGGENEVEPPLWGYNNKSSDYVSLEDLAPLAMDKIEGLSIEGLRIQSDMSDEEAPSSVNSQSLGKVSSFGSKSTNFGRVLSLEGDAGLLLQDVKDSASDVDELIGLSITLDEWLKLDAGVIGEEDVISEHTMKILESHHANCIDSFSEIRFTRGIDWAKSSGRNHSLLGNNLTLAFMVQLRDPLRNNEPVGASMLALIKVERVFVPLTQSMNRTVSERGNNEEDYETLEEETNDMGMKEKKNDEGNTSQFKINGVHLSGLNSESSKQPWGTTTQRQSGCRWLLANGMGKTNKHPVSKSKAIVRSSSRAVKRVQPLDTLWSISSPFDGLGTHWRELGAPTSHIRNSDVIFPHETMRPHVA